MKVTITGLVLPGDSLENVLQKMSELFRKIHQYSGSEFSIVHTVSHQMRSYEIKGISKETMETIVRIGLLGEAKLQEVMRANALSELVTTFCGREIVMDTRLRRLQRSEQLELLNELCPGIVKQVCDYSQELVTISVERAKYTQGIIVGGFYGYHDNKGAWPVQVLDVVRIYETSAEPFPYIGSHCMDYVVYRYANLEEHHPEKEGLVCTESVNKWLGLSHYCESISDSRWRYAWTRGRRLITDEKELGSAIVLFKKGYPKTYQVQRPREVFIMPNSYERALAGGRLVPEMELYGMMNQILGHVVRISKQHVRLQAPEKKLFLKVLEDLAAYVQPTIQDSRHYIVEVFSLLSAMRDFEFADEIQKLMRKRSLKYRNTEFKKAVRKKLVHMRLSPEISGYKS